MRLALFGGTFNPVHIGHLFVAEEVRRTLGYDRIVFVPANVPVHKVMEVEIEPRHRLRMLQLAVEPFPAFEVDDCELARGGNSYTIDTVRDYCRRYPEGKPGLIIGDDLAEGFYTWKAAARLAEMADIILVQRLAGRKAKADFPCRRIENFLLPISSSEIRARLRVSRTVRFLVPDPVFCYIEKNELYR